MTKNIIILAFATLCFLSACTDETKVSHMGYLEKMKDTIFKKYNTVTQVTVEITDENMLDIKLWDTRLFNAGQAQREEVAAWVGQTASKMYQDEGRIEKGVLNVTRDNDSGILSSKIIIPTIKK